MLNNAKINHTRNEGFALILVIVLMTFILLLLLSMSTIVRIDLAVVETSENDSQAKQNALLGLLTALSEIQEHSGPDQRVTARADIIGDDLEHPYWTGVWRSDDAAALPVWLISGNEGLEPEDPDFVTPASELPEPALGGKSVWLVRNVVEDANNQVKVPTVEIIDNNGLASGCYAYWVSDESIKAKFNIPSESIAINESAQVDAPATISYNFGVNLISEAFMSNDIEERLEMSRTSNLNDLSIIVGEDVADSYYHDLSPWGMGVLSDTKNGGLKKDLTYAFENETIFNREFGNPSDFDPGQSFFFLDGVVDNGRLTGPNWGVLRSYYQLYESVDMGTEIDIQTPVPALNASLRDLFFPYKHGRMGIRTDDYQRNNPLFPVISRVQIDVNLSTESTTADPAAGFSDPYKIRLEIKPTFAIYNPYNVKINTSQYRINWEINPVFRINIDGHEIDFDFSEMGVHGTDLDFIIMTTEAMDIQPGETLFFSPSAREQWNEGNYYKILKNKLAEDGVLYHTITEGLDEDIAGSEAPILVEGVNPIQLVSVTLNDDAYIALKQVIPGVGELNLQRISRLWQSGPGKTPGVATGYPSYPASYYGSSVHMASWLFHAQTSTEENGVRIGVDNNLRGMAGDTAWDGYRDGIGNVAISPLTAIGADNGLLSGGVPYEPETPGESDGRYEGLWGNSVGVDGAQHAIMFDVPRKPLLSIGALQHANLSRYTHQPAFVIGNSYANPRIELSNTKQINFSESGLDVYDLPYLINDQIWDRFFFSSVDPSLSTIEYGDLIANERQRNKRYVFHNSSSSLIDAGIFEEARDDEGAYDALASRFMVDGVFNVNSTSVAAWTAVLGSMQDLELPTYDPESGAVSMINAETYFTRLSTPYGSDYSHAATPSYDNFWNGFHQLSAEHLRNLAQEIVDRIKLRRQPFRSMGEFVNRSLTDYPDDVEDNRKSGILQAALDSVEAGINSGLPSELGHESEDLESSPFYDNFQGSKAAGFPGFLLQGDILQALGPVLSVRSDTFIVRAYGCNRDQISGTILGEAYCEAVVQRYPEPVEGDMDDNGNRANPSGAFGRRYHIISFRWLDNDEV